MFNIDIEKDYAETNAWIEAMRASIKEDIHRIDGGFIPTQDEFNIAYAETSERISARMAEINEDIRRMEARIEEEENRLAYVADILWLFTEAYYRHGDEF